MIYDGIIGEMGRSEKLGNLTTKIPKRLPSCDVKAVLYLWHTSFWKARLRM